MPNDWEDDDFFDDEESSDLGEEEISSPASVAPILKLQPEISKYSHNADKRKSEPNRPKNRQPRRIRVKTMSLSMQSRWPDVVSCLLTLHSGKQVMFVKGE